MAQPLEQAIGRLLEKKDKDILKLILMPSYESSGRATRQSFTVPLKTGEIQFNQRFLGEDRDKYKASLSDTPFHILEEVYGGVDSPVGKLYNRMNSLWRDHQAQFRQKTIAALLASEKNVRDRTYSALDSL
jgi:hypothetical protein